MRKIIRFILLILLIIPVINCNNIQSESRTGGNGDYEELQQLWDEYLSALKTGDESIIQSVSSGGCDFTKVWFDPDRYSRMCVAVGNGWSKSDIDININSDSFAVGFFRVKLFTKAFFYFGPEILVYFEKSNNKWEIDYISFEGD